MRQQLEEIRVKAEQALSDVANIPALEELRVELLGKKGKLTAILKQMGGLSPEERPLVGQLANEVREKIEQLIDEKKKALSEQALAQKLKRETLDVTLPGTPVAAGKKHPMTQVLEHLTELFLGMGFSVVEGPEVEFDKYNFELLNIPKGHPARDESDTFYVSDNVLLRTHTSPVQARAMLSQKPPLRIISPGRVYRSDTPDATHSPIFHQIEGLVVDKGITMSDLKGTLEVFAKSLYGDDVKVRFRPHHFQFTEPSAEMDITCFKCGGKGCSFCKGDGFIEILGCGMVHPKVLSACGIDPEVYTGFAFGIGLERLTMFRYGIDDLRLFFENDSRFLSQF